MSLYISSHSEESVLLGSLQNSTLGDIARATTLAISMSLSSMSATSAPDDSAVASVARAAVTQAKGTTLPPIKPIDSYSVQLPEGSRINIKLVPESTTLFYTLAIDTKKIHGVQVNIAPWMGLEIPDDKNHAQKKQILFKFLADTIENDPKLNGLDTIHITTPKIQGFPQLREINGKTIVHSHNPMLDPSVLSISISDVPVLDNAMVQQILISNKQGKNETTGMIKGSLATLIFSVLSGYWAYRTLRGRKKGEEAKTPNWSAKEFAKNKKTIIEPSYEVTPAEDIPCARRVEPSNYAKKGKKISPIHTDTHDISVENTDEAIQHPEQIENVKKITVMLEEFGYTVPPPTILASHAIGTVLEKNLTQIRCVCSTGEKEFAIKITEQGKIYMKTGSRKEDCKPYSFDQLCTFFKNNQHIDTNTKENPLKQSS